LDTSLRNAPIIPPQLDTTTRPKHALAKIRPNARVDASDGCNNPAAIDSAAPAVPTSSHVRRRTKKSVIGLHRKYSVVGSPRNEMICEVRPIPTCCCVSRNPRTPPWITPFSTTAEGATNSPKIHGRSPPAPSPSAPSAPAPPETPTPSLNQVSSR
jgi:hypothetical protein